MADPSVERLRAVGDFPSLVAYLRDDLDWPLDSEDIEDLAFNYDASELGLDDATAAKVNSVKQLRPLATGQPWGIFYIEFEPKQLPVVALRRILSHLVLKKRASASDSSRAAWRLHDLLFISCCGEDAHRDMTFAHFSESSDEPGALATLRVVEWDDEDTLAHLVYAHTTLAEKLKWPDNPTDAESWRQSWSEAFTLRPREVITTARVLAMTLARLGSAIRRRVNRILAVESPKGPMRKLMVAFRESLLHDLSEDDFADTYAQTVTYGLLIAALQNNQELSLDSVATQVPETNPFLRELLTMMLLGGASSNAVDFDEVGMGEVVDVLAGSDMNAVRRDFDDKNPAEDPVIHFYELFLKEYDSRKRMQRGVFFTPRPVVSCIVRSVDAVLRSEFGLEDGLASTESWGDMRLRLPALRIPNGVRDDDPFVQILDPATGTGTFLVEVIRIVHETMTARWRSESCLELEIPGLWNDYVSDHLLPRLHGFELMMAPYAIAHMKVGLKLRETGYDFRSRERLRIYLTNTLEEASDVSDQLELLAPPLAHEASAANAAKRSIAATVVLGNPPYSGISSNMNPWIDGLLKGRGPAGKSIGSYYEVDGAPLGEKKVWLQDDYVKFMRYAQWRVQTSGIGIVALITNHSYTDNPTFRGMRQCLMRTFDEIRIVDLNGSTKRERSAACDKDENVFDIEQGVAICVMCRRHGATSSQVTRSDIWGTRQYKYDTLSANTAPTLAGDALQPNSPYYFFVQRDESNRAEYECWHRLEDVMPYCSTGIITARDGLLVDMDRQKLLERIADLRDESLSDEAIRERYFGQRTAGKYLPGDSRGWRLADVREKLRKDAEWQSRAVRYYYRPFDVRWLYNAPWMVDWPRPKLQKHVVAGGGLGLYTCRQTITTTWRHVLPTRGLTDDCYVSNKTRERGYMFPLHLSVASGQLGTDSAGKGVNLSNHFTAAVTRCLGVPQFTVGADAESSSWHPEDCLAYIYAILASAEYRSRYAPFLHIEFPRVPLPRSTELFWRMASLGQRLITLYLPDDEETFETRYVGRGEPTVEKVEYVSGSGDTLAGSVSINPRCAFEPVDRDTWQTMIGGYQVCHKWLKDRRGRTLSEGDIAHYEKIVVAIAETIRIMAEIDEVIEEHGGWPAAFAPAGD